MRNVMENTAYPRQEGTEKELSFPSSNKNRNVLFNLALTSFSFQYNESVYVLMSYFYSVM